MKKTSLAALAVALMLGASSCLKESKNEYTVTNTVPVYNLFTSIDGAEDPYVGTAIYSMVIKMPANNVTVEAKNVGFPGSYVANGAFTTVEMPFSVSHIGIDGYNYEAVCFESKTASESNPRITDFKGELTQAVFGPGAVELKEYRRFVPGTSMHYAFFEFTLNNTWRVRSFWPDMTFRGKTVLTSKIMPEPFESDKAMYRVVMNYGKDGGDIKKADIIIYNVRTSAQALETTLVLKGLDLAFSNEGYTLSGENIVPMQPAEGKLVATPDLLFNSISFKVGGNLTTAVCDYSVAGMIDGNFTGACMASASK